MVCTPLEPQQPHLPDTKAPSLGRKSSRPCSTAHDPPGQSDPPGKMGRYCVCPVQSVKKEQNSRGMRGGGRLVLMFLHTFSSHRRQRQQLRSSLGSLRSRALVSPGRARRVPSLGTDRVLLRFLHRVHPPGPSSLQTVIPPRSDGKLERFSTPGDETHLLLFCSQESDSVTHRTANFTSSKQALFPQLEKLRKLLCIVPMRAQEKKNFRGREQHQAV